MSQFLIMKVDPAKRHVFGWANVSVTSDGENFSDLQDDIIPPESLEGGAYGFVKFCREAGDMHVEGGRGVLIESCLVTPEKLDAMGLAPAVAKGAKPPAPQVGWWVGFEFDAEAFEMVRNHERQMFSIQGAAEPV